MILSSTMLHLTAVVTRRHMDAVTRVLLKQGVMDFLSCSDIPALNDLRLKELEIKVTSARLKEARLRIETLLKSADIRPVPDGENADTGEDSLDKIEKMLDALSSEQQGFRDKQQGLQAEINRLEDLRRQVGLFGDDKDLITRAEQGSSGFSFLFMETGGIPAENTTEMNRELGSLTTVVLEAAVTGGIRWCIVMGMKKDQKELERRLEAVGWRKGPLPPEAAASLAGDRGGTRFSDDMRLRVQELKTQQKTILEESRAYVEGKKEWLLSTWSALRIRELNLKIQSYFAASEACVLFNGWVPAEEKPVLDAEIKKAAGGECLLEWHGAEWVQENTGGRVSAPVQMNNPGFLGPFEMLVKNFGVPGYGTVDPTVLVAFTYLTMFGLMFGDAGHGLVLVLTGGLLHFRSRRKQEEAKPLFTLIAYCGGAAVVAGILFGSYFGYSWFPPLWFNYHGVVTGHGGGHPVISSIYDILLITIVFGIIVLALGIVLNIINCIRQRDWLRLVFNKAGILGGVLYAGGIYTAFFFVGTSYKELPSPAFLFLGLGLPALLLLFKEPLEHRQEGHRMPWNAQAVMNLFMEWVVELLEIFSGYLANTLSFMRVAGLGIAHVSLMSAFFQMADMAGAYGAPVILLLGNALVIALEGLSAGIQSLRLNYYEFFSKYFNGTGRAYEPVSLKTRVGGN